jgi:hypothetical protein
MERDWDKEQLSLYEFLQIRNEIWIKIQRSFDELKSRKKEKIDQKILES